MTAILPRQSTHQVLDAVLASGAHYALTTSARGSMINERWYQSFLPSLSPEQEMVTFLVPNEEADTLMEEIVMVGKLQLYGAGSIFAIPCENLICAEDYPRWKPGNYTYESVSFDIKFRKELIALVLITEKDNADAVAKAAIKAGAPGPTISYVRGYGLRDRLGLLRITKTHDKELVTAVVDRCDVEAVFQAMAEAGKIDQPGRGIIYQVPISKGLTNLASVFNAQKHSASIQQIVRAIDEIQGGTDWRANQLLIHDPNAREFRQNTRGVVNDRVVLNVNSRRKDTDELLQTALQFGVPGASVSNWRFAEAEAEQTSGGLRINREIGNLSMILPLENAKRLQTHLMETIVERGIEKSCLFTIPAPVVKTYISSSPLKAKKA
ncbi:MAG: P-II family nitrogen regulator [Verrucomicrobiota bacterium]